VCVSAALVSVAKVMCCIQCSLIKRALDFIPGSNMSSIQQFPANSVQAKFVAGFPDLADFSTDAEHTDYLTLNVTKLPSWLVII